MSLPIPTMERTPPQGMQIAQEQPAFSPLPSTPAAARTPDELSAAFAQVGQQAPPRVADSTEALRCEAALRALGAIVLAQSQAGKPMLDLAGDWAWRYADDFIKYQGVRRKAFVYQNGAPQVAPPSPPMPAPSPVPEITSLPPNTVQGINLNPFTGEPLQELK